MTFRPALAELVALFVSAAWGQQHCLPQGELATAPSSRYVLTRDGDVKDTQTQLVWRRCLEGQVGEQCAGAALALNWAEALIYPHKLNRGKKNAPYWRIPNVRELSSLVELRCANPALNSAVFTGFDDMAAQRVWTASPYHFYTHYAWYVDFNTGATTYDERIKKKALLLVREEN